MNKEKNYQKSDHNKKQKKSFIDLIKLQTNLHITDKIEDCFMVEQVYGRFFLYFLK